MTGRPPFVGDESVVIITQHLNTPPVAPSWHNRAVLAGLEALILRLLEKNPAKRPGSASDVRQMLASVGSPSPQPSPTSGEGVVISSPPPSAGEGEGEGAPRGSGSPLYRRVFVGREAELRRLESAFDAALSGAGSLVMVVGEPGIGKTALCEQVATYVALRGGKTLVGHCYEEGSLSLPYLPFVEALRSCVLGQEPDRLKQQLGTGAGDVARIISEVRDRLQVEVRQAGDPDDDRWRLFQAIIGFLRNASTVQPIVLVLEDLHWADRGTLDYLVHLLRNLGGSRLLVIGTYRDVEVDRTHPLSSTLAELRRLGELPRVLLRGLTVDDVQRMINALQGQNVRWSFAEAVHRQTEGNPLFVQEVLRYLVEEGLIVRKEGRWEGRWRDTGEPPPEMSIPEGLRDVIDKRLSKLSPECNRLLSMAAVIGREFRLDVLEKVGSAPEESLFAAVREATGTAVLEERSSVGSVVTYRFSHAFFRQTLYEEMIAPERIRLHQRVAKTLAEVYATRWEEHAVELAEHFSYYSDPVDLAKSVTYGEMAARRAMGVFAYREAVGHLERCLRVQEVLDPDDQARHCDLLLSLGEALMPAGEPRRVFEEVAEEALGLAEALGDGQRASRTCTMALLAQNRYAAGAQQARAAQRVWAERADRYALPGTADRVFADTSLTTLRAGAERWQVAVRALELARQLGDNEAYFFAVRPIIVFPVASKHLAEQLPLVDEVLNRPRLGASPRTLAGILHWCGVICLGSGDRRRAEELWREVAELAERPQDPAVLVYVLVREVLVAYFDGELESAAEKRAQLIPRGEELGSPGVALTLSGGAGRCALVNLGRFDEAVADYSGQNITGWTAAHLLALAGRRAEAELELGERTPLENLDETFAATLMSGLGAANLLGDRGLAEAILPVLAASAGQAWIYPSGETYCPGRILGGAAVLLGRTEEARGYYRQALAVCEKVRFRPEIALIRFELAELLAEHYPKERAEALEHLGFAIAEFEGMKMAPSLERALALKARIAE